MTSAAYAYLRNRYARRIFAVKGSNASGDPVIGRASWNTRARVRLYIVGTDIAKSTLYGRLRQTER
jgi:phage terminase large subunit GpA-like protein